MATVKINCPKCGGYGLTGTLVEIRCSQCAGTGTISVLDTDTLSAINTASVQPLIVTIPTLPPIAAVKNSQRGK